MSGKVIVFRKGRLLDDGIGAGVELGDAGGLLYFDLSMRGGG